MRAGKKLSFLLAFCLPFVQTATAIAKETALRLDQTHSFMGRGQLTVSAKGVRLENKDKLKFTLVAKAPDWRVTIFRNDDKTYFSESLKEFESSGLFSGFVMLPPGKHLRPTGFSRSAFNFCGREAICMTSRKATLKYMPLGIVAPEAESIVYAAYKTPTNGGLPLVYVKAHGGKDYTSAASQHGRLENIIDTSKIETIEDNAKFYTAPSGYKLVKSLGLVFAGSSVRNDSVDFQNLFDMKLPGGRK
jgi:hypothetical protein